MRKSILFLTFSILLMSACKENSKRLPYLQLTETQKMVDGKIVIDSVFKTIPNFSFLDQDSTVFTLKNLENSIYVADFFFTSCPSICPTMHRNLLKVYKKYEQNTDVKYISHSIDVKYDKPSVMKKYAKKLGVDTKKWSFLWGSRDSIYAIAERNYLVAVKEDKNDPSGFVHQGYLILVDKQQRIRGAYDGTDEKQVQQLMTDIDILLKEYEK
ncbi:MAG: SCO family protein [Sphingobacteriaceae bacterium]|nr:SCO family protein [Sphingobacteriaceae bacterium]